MVRGVDTAAFRRSRGVAVALASALTLVTGCGSTVHLASSTAGPAAGNEMGTQPMLGASSAAPAQGATSGGPASATAGGSGAAASPEPAGSAASSPRGGVFRLGFTFPDAGAAARGDAQALKPIADALVADLNTRGGLAGRYVVSFVRTYPASDPTQLQSACMGLTQDDHVDLAVVIRDGGVVTRCFRSAHVPVLLRTYASDVDDAQLRSDAPWALPDATPDLDTQARQLAAALVRRHLVSGGVGIASLDYPADRRAVDHVLLPALRAAGATVNEPDVVYGKNDPQDGSAAAQSAVLRWSQDHVRRVVLFGLPTLGWTVLARDASNQGYHPTWLLNSDQAPETALALPTSDPYPPTPMDQRSNSFAVGFYPSEDVAMSTYPLTPREQKCLGVVNRHNSTTYNSRDHSSVNGSGALMLCDLLDLARAMLAREVGRPLDRSRFYTDLLALRSSYHPAAVPDAMFAPGKADGSSVYADVSYDSNCSCYRYTSGWKSNP